MNFLNMSFYNGTTRFVVTIPCLNIALKIAHIHPIRALQTLLWITENSMIRKRPDWLKDALAWSDEMELSLRWQFRGIYCNLREYRFFKRTMNPFLWPTVFSLFGLINIQPLARIQPLEKYPSKMWSWVKETTKSTACDDGHTFSEEDNYAIDSEGHLRILDYGSVRGQKVILKYGRELYAKSRGLF
jgi:hypothetical protein